MSKLNMSRIDDAETMLRKELSQFKQKNREGKDLKRLKLLEGAVQHLEMLRLLGIVFLLALALVGCVADESIPHGDDVQEPDAGDETPDAKDEPDTAPIVGACDPVGSYSVTFEAGLGTCGSPDLGVLTFDIVETGSGAWQVTSEIPLVGGTVFDVDGKCAIDVWRAAPYGQSVMQIHAALTGPEEGVAHGVAQMGLYNYQSGITCEQAYVPTATVEG